MDFPSQIIFNEEYTVFPFSRFSDELTSLTTNYKYPTGLFALFDCKLLCKGNDVWKVWRTQTGLKIEIGNVNLGTPSLSR